MEEGLSLSENEFALFCDVITSLHTIRDMDDMLVAIFQKIRSIIDIQGISIALHDPEKKEFYFIRTVEEGKSRGESQEDFLRFPDNIGVAGWVMDNRCCAVINDVSSDTRFYSGLNSKDEFITHSMICAPLCTRKGFLGVFYALNKEGDIFTPRDEKILEILSGTIAVSLENARLYGELKDHLHDLKQEKKLLQRQVNREVGFNRIIGSSPPMRQMFELMEKVIHTTTTVLIQGETGTGKELVAKVIHYNGPLKNKPFVAENCGALPESLLESELFGYVRGAFTGAITNKKGLFEIADGGTIFLDEIGEMSPILQVKLLRVLQEGEFRPVGSNRSLKVNVRIIASTNRDLPEEIEKGRFREDLYYRINIFQITPPPLRRRKEDILALAGFFLEKYATRNSKPVPTLTPQALDLLMRYDWPGNVRELENEMQRAQTMAYGGKIISPDFLSDKIRRLVPDTSPMDESCGATLKDTVRQVERRMIDEALTSCQGNQSKAAKALGLSRQGLLNKIAAYNIHIK
ncbi:MAG: sigma 54-interacting transcriptional regulator [Desulfopila sp.]|jgi:Nif-specific regulatory protein|nr:sigma 54-interacting transcriptional regulator [Desulfopila sp.]